MTTDERRLNSHQQIEVLQRLTQQAAAWLAGVSARSLRDHPDVPRSGDGTYDGRDVARWLASRWEPPQLIDDEVEKLAVIAEELAPDVVAPYTHAFEHLRARFGDAAYAVLGRAIANYWRRLYDAFPDDGDAKAPSEPELRQQFDQWVESAMRQGAECRLEIAVVCDRCGKLRHGPRWVAQKLPQSFAIRKGLCPTCTPSATT